MTGSRHVPPRPTIGWLLRPRLGSDPGKVDDHALERVGVLEVDDLLVGTAPLVVVYFFAQRKFLEGIALSGIKG